jgi:outer membrane lipoprotein-sorting protein
LRRILWLLLATGLARAAALPSWWTNLSRQPRLESDFVQESESAVFGKLTKSGTLQLAKGGRLRVTYVKGMVLVADGTKLIQYDPAARTAQRMDLRSATKDMPLLNVLVEPSALEGSYSVQAVGEERIQLKPRRKDLPQVTVEGHGAFLTRVSWTDPTGAKQSLELKNPHVPKADFPPSLFKFVTPAGTRWIEGY